jgi:hypothetical protein
MKHLLIQAITNRNSITGQISKSMEQGDFWGLNFTIFFIILFNLSVLTLRAQNTAQWSNISTKLGSVASTSNLVDLHFINDNEGLISSGNTSEVYVTKMEEILLPPEPFPITIS